MRYIISDVNDNTGLHSMGGLEPTKPNQPNPTSRRRKSELKRRKRKEKRK